MTTVFIVRPFGNNREVTYFDAGKNVQNAVFNFDDVERLLIRPAMNAAGLKGGTTGEIFAAGEIREDMFQQLLVADIVIAEISVHNANVFYELGIRHAFRNKRTILLKSPGYGDHPFDINGYKYVTYDKDNPAKAVDNLIKTIKETLRDERTDSPVFNMLNGLQQPDIERFLTVPEEFLDEVEDARNGNHVGRLLTLAEEASFFYWEIPALRRVGKAIWGMKQIIASQGVWEKIRKKDGDDYQANERLSTIYQRIAEIENEHNPAEAGVFWGRSDAAIDTLSNTCTVTDLQKRAEIEALKGRNHKSRWIATWKKRTAFAIYEDGFTGGYLKRAFEAYKEGFYINLNHYYSGINAFALQTIMVQLSQKAVATGALSPNKNNQAIKAIEEGNKTLKLLEDTLQFVLNAEREKLGQSTDIWLDATEADFSFLTSSDIQDITSKYEKIFEDDSFPKSSALKQISIFKTLDIFTEKAEAVLELGDIEATVSPVHTILFTGHMIDRDDRKIPRFPKEKEAAVRKAIAQLVKAVKNTVQGRIIGIAGGACGGDILFHEVCEEEGIETELYLALPADIFKVKSVAFAGNSWIKRFDNLYQKLQRHTLCDTEDLPGWLQEMEGYTIWERNNLWELNSALLNGGMHMTLIALWDKAPGDGRGGTEHMVDKAKKRGANVEIIDINSV